MMFFGAGGLVISLLMNLGLQRRKKIELENPSFDDHLPQFMQEYFRLLHDVGVVWMPLLTVLSVVWFVGGGLLYRDGKRYQGWIRVSFFLGLLWLVGYVYSLLPILDVLGDNIPLLISGAIFQSVVIGFTLLVAVILLGLGYSLHKEYR